MNEEINPKLAAFLETDDFDEKYEILCSMDEDELTDLIIDNMAVTIDTVIEDGPISERADRLKYALRTRKKYESRRLRG